MDIKKYLYGCGIVIGCNDEVVQLNITGFGKILF
jgi:hypothetical protein